MMLADLQIRIVRPAHVKPEISLTQKQLLVLQLISEGKRYGEIAKTIGVSQPAVWQVVYRVCNALGANTTAGAVAIAFRKGLIV